MDLQKHKVEKLVMNRRFQRWVKHSTPKLDAFWADWMAQQPERKQLVAEAKQIVLAMHFADDLTEAEIGEEWGRLQRLIQRPERSLIFRNNRIYWQAAAVFVGVLVSVSLLYAFLRGTPQREYVTGNGETKTVKLPDGSAAILNANSRIEYPEEWEPDEPREVWLEGEAYFSVTHQANHQRFTVRSEESFTIEVLGTTFAVLNRKDRNRVVLHTGKVRLETGLSGQDAALVLKPGDLVEVEAHSGSARKKKVNPETYLAFKDRKLVFDNTPLAEVGRRIQDTYGLQVLFTEGPLLAKEFTGTFPMEKQELLLQALRRAYQLEIRRDGNRLFLESKTTTP